MALKLSLGIIRTRIFPHSIVTTTFPAYSRQMSAAASSTGSEGFIKVELDETSGIAVLRMNRKPVNSLSLEMLTQLTIALDKLESNKNCNGLIITSALPKIFTAGLDIQELYQPQRDRLAEFWRSLQNFWMKLYASPLVTAAAINGHSPAGGCLVAMSCDYRVMAAGNYSIGLNETQLGIVAPFWFIDTMRNVIGQRQSEKALQLGSLFSPTEALRIGMIDQIADGDVVEAARSELYNWFNIPGYARQLTKQLMRQSTVEKLSARQDEDIETFIKFVTKESIQKGLGRYLEMLKARKS